MVRGFKKRPGEKGKLCEKVFFKFSFSYMNILLKIHVDRDIFRVSQQCKNKI